MTWKKPDHFDRLRRWLAGKPVADVLAVLVLCGASVLWSGLTWGRLDDPIMDKGWYLEAAERVKNGAVLYRDVLWMYGPLPVYLLAMLFRCLGTHVYTLLALYDVLALLGCLLSYAVARSVLPPPLALLGTLAVFLAGWWGGFLAYTQAYTGAVPLGAVAGLSFVVCLMGYLRNGKTLWLVGAGLASGVALLTKPEFALACLGTGVLVLTVTGRWSGKAAGRSALYGLAVYGASTAAVAGLGYGLLVEQTGWADLWAGITGYDQDAILLQEWPPWGTPEAWCYIASGLGVYLLAGMAVVSLATPAATRKRWRTVVLLAGLGVGLTVLPWRIIAQLNPALVGGMWASWPALIQEGIRVIVAPGTVLMMALILALGLRRWRALRGGQSLSPTEGRLTVLVLYSLLADVRSILYPTGTFHFLYLDTLIPVVLFLAAILIPALAERRWHIPAARTRLGACLGAALLACAAAGLIWNADYLSRLNATWSTPRGAVLFLPDAARRQPWPDLLQYILTHTGPDDSFVVLGHEPGFHFWTGRRNPLRYDTLLPGMASSTEDARDIVQRLEAQPPRLIVIPQTVKEGRGWFWDLAAGRRAYADLAPVWDWVAGHYTACTLLGGGTWGYAIYAPRDGQPLPGPPCGPVAP